MEKASTCHFEDLQMIFFREVWIVVSIYMHLYRSGNVDDNLQQIYVHWYKKEAGKCNVEDLKMTFYWDGDKNMTMI